MLTKNLTFSFQFNLLLALSLLFLLGCGGVESEVRATCDRFIEGRKAVGQGDFSILKAITEDTLFQLMELNEEYVKVLNVPGVEPDLNVYTKSVDLQGDCATCLMSGAVHYNIHLCKEGGVWEVKGENDQYPTAEKIAAVSQKIEEYKVFLANKPAGDSVLLVLSKFFNDVKTYINTQEQAVLVSRANDDTIDLLKRIYRYAEQRTGRETLLKEMNEPNYMVFDVSFDEDIISCQFYKEEHIVNLQRKGDSFVVSGLNGIPSKEISNKLIEEKYLYFLRALKLVRAEKYRNKEIK